jgi:hypothetical protein
MRASSRLYGLDALRGRECLVRRQEFAILLRENVWEEKRGRGRMRCNVKEQRQNERKESKRCHALAMNHTRSTGGSQLLMRADRW